MVLLNSSSFSDLVSHLVIQGSVISVIDKQDPDWWMGEMNGAQGLFPSNYVQSLNESASQLTRTSASPVPTQCKYISVNQF